MPILDSGVPVRTSPSKATVRSKRRRGEGNERVEFARSRKATISPQTLHAGHSQGRRGTPAYTSEVPRPDGVLGSTPQRLDRASDPSDRRRSFQAGGGHTEQPDSHSRIGQQHERESPAQWPRSEVADRTGPWGLARCDASPSIPGAGFGGHWAEAFGFRGWGVKGASSTCDMRARLGLLVAGG